MTEGPTPAPRPAFAHASEAELARILDFYQVRWAYEPDTFPIGWNLDGEVVESFSPDFYLPDFEIYVELTTLKQSLVRKKNRKLRRLRELYPDVRIKLFYARDFRMLLLKFGRLALAPELSGTTGQATPPRDHADEALAEDAALDRRRRRAEVIELVRSQARGEGAADDDEADDETGADDHADAIDAIDVDDADTAGRRLHDAIDGAGDPGRTPRGRRRGRRRRAAARAAALAAGNAPGPSSVTHRAPNSVSSPGTLPG